MKNERKAFPPTSQDIVAAVAALMERSRAATESVLSYLASESTSEGGGLHILRPFLVECSAKDVRACFSDVLYKTFRYMRMISLC